MRKIFITFILIFIGNLVISAQTFSGGNGSSGNPFLISSKADLDTLSHYVNAGNDWSSGKFFKQTQDILEPFQTCIGIFDISDNKKFFQGNYNGAGYSIMLDINNNTMDGVGLFGAVFDATFDSVVTLGYVVGKNNVSGLIGATAPHKFVIIRNCINAANITGVRCVGGIIGDGVDLNRCVIRNCLNIGKITAQTGWCGGIAGDDCTDKTADSVISCMNAGIIKTTEFNYMTGGIIGGDFRTDLFMNRCLNVGIVNMTEGSSIGSLVGISISGYKTILMNNFYDKQISKVGGYNNKDIINEAEGRLTNNLSITGNAIRTQLGNNYIYEDCMYPRLGNHPAHIVAASPIFLNISEDNIDYDIYDNINHCFTISDKYDVKWESINGRVTINGTIVTLNSIGYDTLVCSIGDFKKIIPIRINSINNNLAVINTDCFTDDFDFSLSTRSSDISKGTTTGNGSFKKNVKVFISAIPIECYHFVYWKDTLENILPLKQFDSLTIKGDSVIIAVFEQDTFLLTTNQNILEAGIINESGIYVCNDTAIISAIPNECFSFVYWIDENQNVLPLKQIDTICMKSDTNIIAVFVRDSFNLELFAAEGIVEGAGYFECGSEVSISAIPNECYEFFRWIEYVGESIDTISTNRTEKIFIDRHRKLYAVFEDISTIFTFEIDNILNVLPTATSLSVPFFITSNKSVPALTIDTLILKVNHNVFLITEIEASGNIVNYKNDTIIITNITTPNYPSQGKYYLKGIPLLGNAGSTSIEIIDVKFPLATCAKTEFINGSLTIATCDEGGNRLITHAENTLTIVEKNIVNYILKIECFSVETGNYFLEIVDILGNTITIKEWKNTQTGKNNFEIPVNNLGNGIYILRMTSPSRQYYENFIIVK